MVAADFMCFLFCLQPNRTYYLEDPEGNALKWCEKLQEVFHHYYESSKSWKYRLIPLFSSSFFYSLEFEFLLSRLAIVSMFLNNNELKSCPMKITILGFHRNTMVLYWPKLHEAFVQFIWMLIRASLCAFAYALVLLLLRFWFLRYSWIYLVAYLSPMDSESGDQI